MIESMPDLEQTPTAADVPRADSQMDPALPPTAYIPACGTLCDAFWWARPSRPPKSAD
jgi:hypothetical protein